jgi:hypothetical protein
VKRTTMRGSKRSKLLAVAVFGASFVCVAAVEGRPAFAGPATFITTIPVGGKISDVKGCVAEKTETADPHAFYRATLTVLGVTWPEQARLVELSLKGIPGARAAKFDMADGTAVVDFAPGVKVSKTCIRHVIRAESLSPGPIRFDQISFAPAPFSGSAPDAAKHH